MKKMKRMRNVICVAAVCVLLAGCSVAGFGNKVNSLKGSIKGNTYTCDFYTNTGEKFLTAKGTNIDFDSNVVKEKTWNSDDGWGYTKTLSSVVTITIDGKQMESCGSTGIFTESGLEKDVDFQLEDIESSANGIGDTTFIAKIVNDYKNFFGKGSVVVIQSQLGNPICAYSGDDVYWEVCEDLPKTTKLMIDGKALYIHRANFVIIDKALLE